LEEATLIVSTLRKAKTSYYKLLTSLFSLPLRNRLRNWKLKKFCLTTSLRDNSRSLKVCTL